METRAHHIAVGAFVLLLMAGAAIFVVWISKYQAEAEYAYYDLLIDDDVTGLSVDGPVRYRGVVVGRVSEIKIDPENPTRVRVTIEVAKGTPIHVDSVASLEPQGITGVLYVLLSGGSEGGMMLPQTTEPPFPVIAARPGKFAAILASAPELLNAATALVKQVQLIFDDKNRAAIASTLDHINSLTSALADNREGLSNLVTTGTSAAAEIRTLAQELKGHLGTITGATMAAQQDLHNVSEAFSGAAQEIQTLVSANQRPIADFTNGGLYEASQLLVELRLFIDTMQRIAVQFERDPARFLFGDRQKGYEAQ